MTTTNSLDRIGGTATDVSVLKLTEADLLHVQTDALPNGGAKSIYTMNSGDPRYPTTVVAQVKPDPRGNAGKGVRSCLLALNTWARTETDGIVDIISPISAVLSFSIPMDVAIDIADLHDMVEDLFSLTYSTITSKEGDTSRISSLLLFGISEVF